LSECFNFFLGFAIVLLKTRGFLRLIFCFKVSRTSLVLNNPFWSAIQQKTSQSHNTAPSSSFVFLLASIEIISNSFLLLSIEIMLVLVIV